MSETFLQRFHDAHPGATPRALGWGRLASGESSYEYLAAALPDRARLRVVDLGCGDGHLRGLLPAHVDYVGVDLGAADLERARQR